MQGEAAKTGPAVKKGAMHIIRQLGLLGLYKGTAACLCRDVPFSAIYFPAYAHLKKDVFHEGRDGKKLGYGEALAAAAIAGMPAAYLTTPADVISSLYRLPRQCAEWLTARPLRRDEVADGGAQGREQLQGHHGRVQEDLCVSFLATYPGRFLIFECPQWPRRDPVRCTREDRRVCCEVRPSLVSVPVPALPSAVH